MLNRLQAGAETAACGTRLMQMERLARLGIHSRLMFERMEQKFRTIKTIYDAAYGNWNMTFFVMFMRTLGDASNREAFMRVAWKAGYNSVLNERGSEMAVESLLLGTSGLLELYPQDDYTRSLKEEFAHLAHKYTIRPMTAGEWNLRRINPRNHPVLRLAQAAAFFIQNDLAFSRTLECRTAEDVGQMFGAEASEYWATHFTPGTEGGESPKRIGHAKASLIGINLVAPLQFAYGQMLDNDQMRGRAMELLESIDPEDNRYMRRWAAYGAVPATAYDSQALLQLATVYCDRRRCEECPLGRLILRESVSEAEEDCAPSLRSW